MESGDIGGKPMKNLGGQVCQSVVILLERMWMVIQFIACEYVHFLSAVRYEYERKDGNQSCPQCKTRYKRHKGSPAILGVEKRVMMQMTMLVILITLQKTKPKSEAENSERMLSWHATYARGEDVSAPNYDKEVLITHLPLLTNGQEVSGELSAESLSGFLWHLRAVGGKKIHPLYIAAVLEGAVQHIASRRFEVGGSDLTKLLLKNWLLMTECLEHVRRGTYLPDGQVCLFPCMLSVLPCLGDKNWKRKYTVGEALFQPSILGLEAHGIVEQLVRSVATVSSESQKQLLENTVLCGGTTSMTGFESRFQKEASLCSSAIRPCLVKPPEYMPENLAMYSAWVGGAILAKVVFPQISM
ncbi:Actin-related protein 7 [Hibiscus syriacus]|uniref:Actin-related protein 7 n=1 Tax=Hibiscus syriacus TaxID=106335 RepID=A0A6A3CFK5_HIBSY|nr:Actin-related protein 7 [Hibiscus syriacus]